MRERAIATLARRGASAVEAVSEKLNDADVRRRAIWTLARIGTERARAELQTALGDPDAGVRQAAAYSLGDLRDTAALPNLIERLADEEQAVRRQAGTALGQIGSSSAVASLLAALQQDTDRVLEHALIYALIEIDAPAATSLGLASRNSRVRHGALIALDQMAGGRLTREQVAPLLDTDDFALQAAALEVIGRHPAWGEEIVALLGKLLAEPQVAAEKQAMVRGALYAFRSDKEIQQLVAKRLSASATSSASKRLLLEAVERSDLKPMPEVWIEAVAGNLVGNAPDVLYQAVTTAAAIDAERLIEPLRRLATDDRLPDDLRIAALAAVGRRGGPLQPEMFKLLSQQIEHNVPPMQRLAAARALGAAELSEQQQIALAGIVARAAPLELARAAGRI